MDVETQRSCRQLFLSLRKRPKHRHAHEQQTHLIPGAHAVVGPPPPHVQRPKRAPEQRRYPRQSVRLYPPPVEWPSRAPHQLHPRPVRRLPAAERGPPPCLADVPLPLHQLPEGHDLWGEAPSGGEAAPLGLDALRCVGAEDEDDLRRGELVEVTAVLGAGDERVLGPAQGYVRGALFLVRSLVSKRGFRGGSCMFFFRSGEENCGVAESVSPRLKHGWLVHTRVGRRSGGRGREKPR